VRVPANPDAPVRVLVVDDQVYVREGLKTLLEIEEAVEVVGEARDGVEALRQVALLGPDVALVDARMPRMDGIELIGRLSEEHPEVACIVLTTFDEDELVFGGLRAGARGYLLKDTPPEELVAAIEKVRRGEDVLGAPVLAKVISELRRAPGPSVERRRAEGRDAGALSEREAEVLGLVGRGDTNKEIAEKLFIAEGTAKNHVHKILRKLGLRDRTEAALYAAERGYAESGGTEHRRSDA
jgi:DNA-binding NarL/FixJ family response regulator